MSPRLAQLGNVYNLLSSQSRVDHPLCRECMELLGEAMARELEEGRREVERLKGFERDVAKRREDGRTGNREEMERDIAKVSGSR